MTRYGLVIDITKCTGCDTCLKACKDEFVGNDYPPYSVGQPDTYYSYYKGYPGEADAAVEDVKYVPGHKWMDIVENVRGKFPHTKLAFIPEPCMHCRNAPCMTASTGGAVTRRADGIVLIDPTKAVGQQAIQSACPYGRVYWNAERNLPQKCTLCAHLIDAGGKPKCVEVCPMSAITFGDLDDSNSDVAKLVAAGAETLHPEFGTQPNVFYIGLPKTFLSGTVENGRTTDYIPGATVVLKSSDGTVLTKTTDAYGDFLFDGLKPKRTYTLTISKAGFYNKTMVVFLNDNKDIGHLQMFPSEG
jgi:Fe-S-cluster-containing dehydrogenase component